MKTWLKSFFYIPMHGDPDHRGVPKFLIPPIAGVLLCLICLACLTRVWLSFGSSVPAPGDYTASILVTGDTGDIVAAAEGSYPLEAGTYTVTLTADSAEAGYFTVQIDGQSYQTTPLLAGEPLCFTLIFSSRAEVSFTSHAGTYSGEPTIENGSVINQPEQLPTLPKETQSSEPTEPEETTSPATEPTEPEETTSPTSEPTEAPSTGSTTPKPTAPPSTGSTTPKPTAPPPTKPTEPEETTSPTSEPTEPEETTVPSTEPTEPTEATTPSTEPTEPEATDPSSTESTSPSASTEPPVIPPITEEPTPTADPNPAAPEISSDAS